MERHARRKRGGRARAPLPRRRGGPGGLSAGVPGEHRLPVAGRSAVVAGRHDRRTELARRVLEPRVVEATPRGQAREHRRRLHSGHGRERASSGTRPPRAWRTRGTRPSRTSSVRRARSRKPVIAREPLRSQRARRHRRSHRAGSRQHRDARGDGERAAQARGSLPGGVRRSVQTGRRPLDGRGGGQVRQLLLRGDAEVARCR